MKTNIVWIDNGEFWRGCGFASGGEKEYFTVFSTGIWVYKRWYVVCGYQWMSKNHSTPQSAMYAAEKLFEALHH